MNIPLMKLWASDCRVNYLYVICDCRYAFPTNGVISIIYSVNLYVEHYIYMYVSIQKDL